MALVSVDGLECVSRRLCSVEEQSTRAYGYVDFLTAFSDKTENTPRNLYKVKIKRVEGRSEERKQQELILTIANTTVSITLTR